MTSPYTLASLGWRAFFQQQLSLDEVERGRPARVLTVQRSGITVGDTSGERHIALGGRWFELPSEQRPAVGDWVLLSEQRRLRRARARSNQRVHARQRRRQSRSPGHCGERRYAVRRDVVQRRVQRVASRTLSRDRVRSTRRTRRDPNESGSLHRAGYVRRGGARRSQERCARVHQYARSRRDRRRPRMVHARAYDRARRFVRRRQVDAAEQPRRAISCRQPAASASPIRAAGTRRRIDRCICCRTAHCCSTHRACAN